MIHLDTSVLSVAFRRKAPSETEMAVARQLERLVGGGEAVGIPGIVLQEILSGIREPALFRRLKDDLVRGYAIVAATAGDHIMAAEIATTCREAGAAVSSIDALIAAVAVNSRAQLFTLDADFTRIARHTALRLFAA